MKRERVQEVRLPGDRPKALRLNRQTGITIGLVVILALLPLVVRRQQLHHAAAGRLHDLGRRRRRLGPPPRLRRRSSTWARSGFFALGAYASAMLSENAGLNPWWGLLAGAAVGAIVAVLLGLPSLRLAGIYIALLTLAFYEVLAPLLTVGQAIGTGGKRGISPITPYSVGGYILGGDNQIPWYYIALGLFVLCLVVCYFAINSRFGTSFVALHDSESFAQSLGISRYKVSLAHRRPLGDPDRPHGRLLRALHGRGLSAGPGPRGLHLPGDHGAARRGREVPRACHRRVHRHLSERLAARRSRTSAC